MSQSEMEREREELIMGDHSKPSDESVDDKKKQEDEDSDEFDSEEDED